MDIVYAMPGQQHRMFVNIVHACPNSCLFCVDFKGATFYGFDLKNGSPANTNTILAAVEAYPYRANVREAYYCGIGEPLLLYDRVVESVPQVRALLPKNALIGINTSGTFYLKHPKVDFASKFDLIQVSINAENEEKYNQICRPKMPGAYQAMMAFLKALRAYIDQSDCGCLVELSVVDTSDVAYLPKHEQKKRHIPTPNINACRQIAESFGWPLKVKKLISDCEDIHWSDFANDYRKNAS